MNTLPRAGFFTFLYLVLAIPGRALPDDLAGWGLVVNDTNQEINLSVHSQEAYSPVTLSLEPGSKINLQSRPAFNIIVEDTSFPLRMDDPTKFDASKPIPFWSRRIYSLRRTQRGVRLTEGVPARWKKASRRHYTRLIEERQLPSQMFQNPPESYDIISSMLLTSAHEVLRLALMSELPEAEEIGVMTEVDEGRMKIVCTVPLPDTKQLSPELKLYLKSVASECAQIPLSDVTVKESVGRTTTVSGSTRVLVGSQLNPMLFNSDGTLSLVSINSTLSDALATLPVAMDVAPADNTPKAPLKITYQSDWGHVNFKAVPQGLTNQHVQWRVEVSATIRDTNPQSLDINCVLHVRHKYRGQPIRKFVYLDRATTLQMSASETGFVEWNENSGDVNFEQVQKALSDAIHREFIRSAPERKLSSPPV